MKTVLLMLNENTPKFKELSHYFNPSNADEFFIKSEIYDDGNFNIFMSSDSLYYGVNITNTDSDVWIEDKNDKIFLSLPFNLKIVLYEMLIERYLEEISDELVTTL